MKKESDIKGLNTAVTRRTFVKGMAAVAAASAFTGCSSDNDDDYPRVEEYKPDLRQTRQVYSTCPVECLTHSLNCQLVGDNVIRVEPTRLSGDPYFTTACARGMSRMQFLTENRVATPMKRIKRGTATSPLGVILKDNTVDEWVSISWDQAYEEIGAKLKEIMNSNDPIQGVMVNVGSGNMGPVVNGVIGRFFNHVAPNRVTTAGSMCCQSVTDGMAPVYGERSVDTRDTMNEARCIIAWGNSPADTSSTYWKYIAEAKERGATIISIDPRYSGTAERSHLWLAPYPGTDALIAIAMIRYVFRQDRTGTGSEYFIDEDFLRHRTNAAFLIDITELFTDVSTLQLDPQAYKNLYNLQYYMEDGHPLIYDNMDGFIKAEINNGKGTETQDPDLYYFNSNGTRVLATAYQLMRALYAGDILNVPVPLSGLHDPDYEESNIATVTGVSETDIEKCAKAYATSGNTASIDNRSPKAYASKSMIIQNMGGGQRTENGAHTCALQCILSLITANVGEAGNGVDDTSGYGSLTGYQKDEASKKIGTAITWKAAAGSPTYSMPFSVLGDRTYKANYGNPDTVFAPNATWPANTKDPQIKFWYIATLSLLTQYPNTNALKEALRSTETVVVAKPTWNTDADYCDYFLPVTTQFEYEDVSASNRNKYVSLMEAGVKPYGQAKSDMQIMSGLAKVIFSDQPDIVADFDRTDHEYVRDVLGNTANNFAANGITYEKLIQEKTIRPSSIHSPWVPYWNHEFQGGQAILKRAKIFVTDWQYESRTVTEAGISLTTSSGYPYPRLSKNPAAPLLRGPFPRYIPAMESQLPMLQGYSTSDLPSEYQQYRARYPLCNVQFKPLRSVHASFTGLSWIREAFGEEGIVLINPVDAHARRIYDGDKVTVTSPVGSIARIARVTEFIRPGVTAVENGWWDKYGKLSSSTIAAQLPDPVGCGHTHNNTLVEITKGGQ